MTASGDTLSRDSVMWQCHATPSCALGDLHGLQQIPATEHSNTTVKAHCTQHTVTSITRLSFKQHTQVLANPATIIQFTDTVTKPETLRLTW